MRLSSLSLKILAVSLLAVPACIPAATAGNSVVGSASDASAKDNPPLRGVVVTVQQDEKATDMTRAPDGVYAVNVSDTHTTIDIMFKKKGYTTAFDANVTNDKSPNKRPVVYMAAKGALKKVPKEQLESILKNTLLAAESAKMNKLAAMAEAVKENLKIFKDEIPEIGSDAKNLMELLKKIEAVAKDF